MSHEHLFEVPTAALPAGPPSPDPASLDRLGQRLIRDLTSFVTSKGTFIGPSDDSHAGGRRWPGGPRW